MVTIATAETSLEPSPLPIRIRKLKDRDQVAVSLAHLGTLLQRITNRRARLNARIARNQAKVDTDRRTLGRLNLRDEATALRHARAIYDFEIEFGSIDFSNLTSTKELIIHEATGIVRFYVSSRGKLICNDEEMTARELLEMYPELFFKLVKCTIRKDALKNEPEILATLTTAYTERGVSVSLEPANTDEKLARPVSFFKALNGAS
jgi:hypothetical protein